jgi:transcription initiation factor TFIID TATA-box-binding protein
LYYSSYEPELHPGCTYRLKDISATLKIFSTGSITITAPSVDNIRLAVEQAYSLVFGFKNERRREDIEKFPISERKKRKREAKLLKEQQQQNNSKTASEIGPPSRKRSKSSYEEDFIDDEEVEEEEEEDEESDGDEAQ